MAERPLLEAVLFDAGGTLVRLDFEWISAMLARLGAPVGVEALRRAEIAGRRAYDGSRGVILPPGERHPPLDSRGDAGLYFGTLLAHAGVPGALVPRAVDQLGARHAEADGLWSRQAEGARSCLDELAALGLRLACLSNSDGRAEQHLVHSGVRQGLEFVVDSQREGVEKPDPAIFRIALGRLRLAAGRVLYVGDMRGADGVGARAAGLHFVVIDPYGDYAAPGEPAIGSVGRLPAWVSENFVIGDGRPAG